MKLIDTMEKWEILSTAMKEKGYMLFQMQYSYNHIEGFHARFMREDKRVEVITRNKDVQNAIADYNGK